MRLLAASAKTIAILLCAGLLVFGSARAAGTIVTAIVCSPSMGSTITLYQPVTDSIVKAPNIHVTARVTQASTVNISVDGIMQASVNLETLNEAINVPLQLTEGTHEIKLVSQDICSVQDGLAVAVVTYNPDAQPSQGPRTPPVANPPQGSGASVAGSATILSDVQSIHEYPVDHFDYGDRLVRGMIDTSQPDRPVNTTSAIIALPFIVGAGAFGWIHIRRVWH